MEKKPQKLEVGEESVVMGHVTGVVGKGSVVIGPTDCHGNVILTQPMAVGHGAKAGPGSIAIGYGAYAGVEDCTQLVAELTKLLEVMQKAPDAGENQEAINNVAQAAEAAKANDRGRVVSYLRAGGKWVADFATQVGSAVVATLITGK
jgi:hypothetical protein